MSLFSRKTRLIAIAWSLVLALFWIIQFKPFAPNGHHRQFSLYRSDFAVPCGQVIKAMPLSSQRGSSSATSSPQIIYAKLLVENIYEFNISDRTFHSDGYLTLQWDQEFEQLRRQRDLQVEDLIDFPNLTDFNELRLRPGVLNVDPTSSHPYEQSIRFDGQFYIPNLDMRRSPFNSISLPILVEFLPDDFSLQKIQLIYRDFEPSYTSGEFADLNGFERAGVVCQQQVHDYENKPLNLRASAQSDSLERDVYGRIVINMNYQSDFSSAFFQWLMPVVLITLVASISALLVGSTDNVRLAMPVTAILALVFVQTSYRQTIPLLPYPTFFDLLMSCCFLNCLAMLQFNIINCNGYELRKLFRLGGPAHFRRYLSTSYRNSKNAFYISSFFIVISMLASWWLSGL